MYRDSLLDKKNRLWFANNNKFKSLKRIKLEDGNIRGLTEFDLHFSYPITCFVGRNGSGKTTLLSLCACAYHKLTGDSFSPMTRNGKQYYTFRDFFVFGYDEEGINTLKLTVFCPGVNGDINKVFYKKPSGKWKDYDQRFQRRVTYLGINRIVPPAEDSKHKSRRTSFINSNLDNEIKGKIITYVSRIFRNNYLDINLDNANSKRSDCYLFKAKRDSITYSGFNMGAGENAVFFMLYQLLMMGEGGLLVIDEIELGLHASAQKNLIEVLKEKCCENKCQIICSTHSSTVLESLPPESRFYIENMKNKTLVRQGITAEFAFGALSDKPTQEVKIFVEDEIAKKLLSILITTELRKRVEIHSIGSINSAIPQQIAASIRLEDYRFLIFADGDQSGNIETIINNSIKELDKNLFKIEEEKENIRRRLLFLPGSFPPEKLVIEKIRTCANLIDLVEGFGLENEDELYGILNSILNVEHHDYFYEIAKALNMEEDSVRNTFFNFYKKISQEECEKLNKEIEERFKLF